MTIPVRADLGKYLGLPAEIGKTKTELFNYVKDRVLLKLAGWKEKLINQAGKEVLLLSVALAIPIYAMACFKLPEGLCHQIEAAMARFWWGSKSSNERKIHWMKWSRLCKDKFKGGLGFRNLTDYNLALLAKQGWRLLVSPKCLMARVLKSKYFRDCDFMEARLGSNPSWVWRSIWEGRRILKGGLRWSIGNGSSVRIDEDPWVPKAWDFIPRRVVEDNSIVMVSQLIDSDSNSWRADVIKRLFGDAQAQRILGIPLSCINAPDSLV